MAQKMGATDAARRDMYMLLRATEYNRDTDPITPTERIHEAFYVFKHAKRGYEGDFEIKKDGCHSPSLERAIEEAVGSGEVVRDEFKAGAYWLTPSGIEAAEGPWRAAGLLERTFASDAKDKMTGISDRELIAYLYGYFPRAWTDPGMRTKAGEWGFDAACTLYERAKITITEGARMSGMAYAEFMWAYSATGRPLCTETTDDINRELGRIDRAG
ncbi:MAG: hypothetical protein MPJ06_04930 [Nitrosopumilus sp.]|nr:hypothetical protein [Nitrosopumilus sp.]MDA7943336.1 hypothetical protein [Nitrosopumilus sp.]MDA7999188.1 hypothetical protein [Nitrosopumilus sp.]